MVNADASTPEGRKRINAALSSGEFIEKLSKKAVGSTTTTTLNADNSRTTVRQPGVARGVAPAAQTNQQPVTKTIGGVTYTKINGVWHQPGQ